MYLQIPRNQLVHQYHQYMIEYHTLIRSLDHWDTQQRESLVLKMDQIWSKLNQAEQHYLVHEIGWSLYQDTMSRP